MTRITNWVLSHKRLVMSLWLVVTVAAFLAIGPASKALSPEFSVPGQEGYETNKQIGKIYGSGGDVAPIVPVVKLPDGKTVQSPGVRGELSAAMAKIQKAMPESRVASFASTGDSAYVSKDGRTTFGLVFTPAKGGVDPGQIEARQVETAVAGATVGGAPVNVTGLDALRASAKDGDAGGASVLIEVIFGALGALLVLAFVFRSFMAFVPLLMAMVAIPTTFLLIWPLASITEVSVIVQFLVALIGLGIAIDYALIVVARWREERQENGATNDQAIRTAMQHAGSAVVFSGTTVAISLLALLVLPVPALRSIGIAGVFIALVSVAVATTLLPVVLASVGPRLDRSSKRSGGSAEGAWSRWAAFIVRRRWVAAIASAAVLAALAFAATTIQLGDPKADSLSEAGSARAGLEQLEASSIGTGPLAPFEALVRAGDPEEVAATFANIEGVDGTAAPKEWRSGDAALVTIIPSNDGNSAAGRATIERLQNTPVGSEVTIGGEAAQGADFIDAVYSNFAYLVLLIAGLTFILLARAFRSLVLAFKAVLLNVLSVAAAWGLMVLVWQHGFGSEAIWGIEATGSINVELPIVVFAFLFGLSMDYQVFIISRMREAYDRTGSTETAVIEGIGQTGRLVTSAAMILVLAFVAFAASPGTEAKIFATALGGGILIDATIIRGVLTPAAVAILGPWNWWLPSGAARLLRVEPSPLRPEVAEAPARGIGPDGDLPQGQVPVERPAV